MKGLIIDETWISMILNGEKVWEMRPRATRHRGPMALVRKGSGLVVGVADLAECLAPLSLDDYAATEALHRVPPERQPEAAQRWPAPWVLHNVRRLPTPVPYRHKFGAQSEIVLSPEEAAAVDREASRAGPNGGAALQSCDSSRFAEPLIGDQPLDVFTKRKEQSRMQKPKAKRVIGRIEGNAAIVPITNGNIAHNHIYLRTVLDFFPEGAIGGSDKSQPASELLTVTYWPGPAAPSRTDIAGANRASAEKRSTHYFFRDRKAVGEFFARSEAKEDDEVVIERTGPFSYSVTLRKRQVEEIA
jgi:hypothetical protein